MNSLSTRLFIFVLLIFGLSTTAASAAYTITSSDTFNGAVNVATSISDLQITGTGTEPIPVKLLVTDGTLAFGSTIGLTFTGGSSGDTLFFSGSQAAINAALETLTYTRNNTGTDTLEVSLVQPGEVFFPGTGHLYEYISSTLTWTAAQTAAAGLTRYGAAGYLTTITSQEENDFVADRLANAGWMGASDAATEDDWQWVTGPETGTSFWSGDQNGSAVGGRYENWNSSEPNDSSFNEDCGQFLAGGSGFWNDLPCTVTTLPGYVVEFGAPGDEPDVEAKNITIVTNTLPTVSTFTPADNATGVLPTANLVIEFSTTVSTDTGTIAIRRTDNNSLVESIVATSSRITGGGTDTITIDPSTTLEETVGYYVVIPGTFFKDDSDFYYLGTSASTTWNFTIADVSGPGISSVAASTSATAATVTWTTNENASSKLWYGISPTNRATTTETDTSPRVTAHEVILSALLACTTYTYAVVSTDSSGNAATSSDSTFTTTGCQSNTTPAAATSTNIISNTGGTTSLTNTGNTLSVNTPSNFTSTSTSVDIQILALSSSPILASLGRPSSLSSVGTVVFDVKAIINKTTILDSFDAAVTITYEYTDEDIDSLDESSLWLYHYHDSAWEALDSCSINTSANTISCTTQSFSVFALFGEEESAGSGGSTGTRFGCTDMQATNYKHNARHKQELCRYAESGNESATTIALPAAVQALIKENSDLFARAHAAGIPLPTFVLETLGLSQPTEIPKNLPVRDLWYGMEGEDVAQLQKYLIATQSGPAAAELARVGATRYFGQYTENALSEFQQRNNINPPNGYYGIITRNFIQR